MTFTLSSEAFEDDRPMPARFSCQGDDISPPLAWSGVPAQTQSLALIMDDPDVPKNIREEGMWDHWIVFNIPADLTAIQEGKEPQGTHGLGTGNNTEYYGPCPPDREHRYFFKLYALDCKLDLLEKSTKRDVEAAMKGHVLETAVLMGRYERS